MQLNSKIKYKTHAHIVNSESNSLLLYIFEKVFVFLYVIFWDINKQTIIIIRYVMDIVQSFDISIIILKYQIVIYWLKIISK